MTASSNRFDVLDALRGVCALLVVFFHLPVASHLQALPLTQHGYLFVDFFFVLSGFVIAHAYGGRIASLGEAGRFLVRRIGRVWPLHAVILAAFVLIELCRLWFDFDAATPFARDRAPEAILTNLLLIQAFNIHETLTWNGPAWSISVEMGCYVLFALMMLLAPRRFVPLAALLAVGGALIVLTQSDSFMNTTHDYAFPRAVWGFLLGCLVHRAWRAAPEGASRVARALEPWVLIAACVWVSWARGPWTVPAPLVFAVCVWVFAFEAGPVSRLLSARPLLALGRWSYSIYMTHMLVIVLTMIAARKLDLAPERRVDFGSVWLNDLFALAVIGVIVALSSATYRWIETPGRDAVSRWLARRAARRAAPAAAAV